MAAVRPGVKRWGVAKAKADGTAKSPYMSLTAYARDGKASLIPAVVHVDGTSCLQTVSKTAKPFYHSLISDFYACTGIPMILNTSFNTLPGDPIVESTSDTIRLFLYSMVSIETLLIGLYVIIRKDADVELLLSRVGGYGNVKSELQCPVCSRPFSMETTTTLSDDKETNKSTTRVRMMYRAVHDYRGGGPKDSRGWFETLDDMEVQVLAM